MSEFKGLSTSDLVSMGFKEASHFTAGNSLNLSLGRNRYLSAMCVGQGNEAVFICEKSKIGNHYTDLICIHNRDYDGFITMEKLKALIEWFGSGQKALKSETKPESKWTTIKVVCQKCGHYLNGCHCNHFGDQCPHLNTSMFGDNGLAECFNCNKIINKDREVVGDVDDINLPR